MDKKHNISFRLDNRLDRNGEASILMVLTCGGDRVSISTGVRLAPDYWDADAKIASKEATNVAGMSSLSINADITAKAKTLDEIYLSLPHPKAAAVKDKYVRLSSPEAGVANPKTLLEWMVVFVAEMSVVREWTDATREKFAALANHIRAVDPEMTFEDLDENGLIRLLSHFREMMMPDGAIGMKNSTIGKQFGYLGWFMSWAVRKGLTDNIAFRTFHPALKTTAKKVIYLTDDELERLRIVDLSQPNRRHLERVRDIFLFQCYSGLRYSDAANLRWSDIRESNMVLTTIKTEDTISIELNQYTREILDRYRHFAFPGDRVFLAPTNQEANRYLKVLCRLAEINEPISVVYFKGKKRIDEVHPKYALIGTHAGRRTFVVKALSLGISPYIVMRWTGHSSLQAMKPYMDIVDTAKADAMKLFNK